MIKSIFRALCCVILCAATVDTADAQILIKQREIMANHELYFPKMLKWAGGYVNDPLDAGGATKYDVTLNTWRTQADQPDKDGDGDVDAEDVKLLTYEDAKKINRIFWNKCNADYIRSQSVAESIVEWCWGSGVVTGIKQVQKIVGVKQDGKIGAITTAAINEQNPAELHEKIRLAKIAFVEAIVRRKPDQKRFIKGWKNRINWFKFEN